MSLTATALRAKIDLLESLAEDTADEFAADPRQGLIACAIRVLGRRKEALERVCPMASAGRPELTLAGMALDVLYRGRKPWHALATMTGRSS